MAEQSDAPPIPLEAMRLFGLPSWATIKEIKAKRDALAKQHHPDKGGDNATMAAINAACDDLLAFKEWGRRHRGKFDADLWDDLWGERGLSDDDGAGDADDDDKAGGYGLPWASPIRRRSTSHCSKPSQAAVRPVN